MVAVRRTGLTAFGFLLPTVCFAAETVPTVSTAALLDDYPGLQGMAHGQGLVALYGVPFAQSLPGHSDAREFVDWWLFDEVDGHKDALGVDNVDLVYDSEVNIRNDKFTVFTYTQEIEGLPVHGSVAKILVLLGDSDKIGYIGINLVGEPESPLPSDDPNFSEQDAHSVISSSSEYGHITTFRAAGDPQLDAEKVIYQALDDTLHRTWRFVGSDDDRESYLFFVDTNSRELVGALDLVLDLFSISGSVFGYGTPGTVADNPENPESCPIEMVVPRVEVRAVNAQQEVVQWVYAEQDGSYILADLDEPVVVESSLIGEWVRVLNWAPDHTDDLLVCSNPPDCSPHINGAQTGVDLTFNEPVNPGAHCTEETWLSRYDTSQVNTLLAVQKTHDWFTALHPTSTVIDPTVDCKVNFRLACNAAYFLNSGPPELHFYRFPVDDGPCNFSSFSTIISHEYGHYIVDQLLEWYGYGDGGTASHSFHEGVADAVAALTWDTECLSEDWFKAGLCLRNTDSPDVRLDDPGGAHHQGLALAGAFWDLGKIGNLGEQTAEELFADFLFITRGKLIEQVLIEVLAADDDDADLSNGTPNEATIEAVFIGDGVDQHGWSQRTDVQGDGSVKVGWLGPIDPYDEPEEGVDYFVEYAVTPPNVTLVTTEKIINQVTYAVEKWFIGRVDSVTQEPLDLGTITAEWDEPAYDIIVEVGTEGDKPCRNVHVIDIPAQSSSTYSSVRLELTGSLFGRAQCYPDSSGAGGRIAGYVAGNATRVYAAAIGEGEDLAATLEVGGALWKGRFDRKGVLGSLPLPGSVPGWLSTR